MLSCLIYRRRTEVKTIRVFTPLTVSIERVKHGGCRRRDGCVGLSLAVLLAQHNDVTAVDVVAEKVEKINVGESPIRGPEIEDFLAHRELRLTATLDGKAAYRDAELVVIATPTNYDPPRTTSTRTSWRTSSSW